MVYTVHFSISGIKITGNQQIKFNRAPSRSGIEVHAYCLMGNHYHLLIKIPRGNLGYVMRHRGRREHGEDLQV